MNDNLKIIATFIKEMYLKDINLEEIYEKLKNNNSFLNIK